MESWGPGIIPDKWGDVDPDGESSNSRRFQGGRRRRRSLGPGVIPGRMGSGVPGGQRPNSREFPAVYRSVQIPQKAAEVILESWCYTRRAGTAVILGSWCYTRRTGTAVVQADGGLIPGNSQRCIARYKFPRRRR